MINNAIHYVQSMYCIRFCVIVRRYNGIMILRGISEDASNSSTLINHQCILVMMIISLMHEYQNMNAGGLTEIDLYLEYVRRAIRSRLMNIIKMMIIHKLMMA